MRLNKISIILWAYIWTLHRVTEPFSILMIGDWSVPTSRQCFSRGSRMQILQNGMCRTPQLMHILWPVITSHRIRCSLYSNPVLSTRLVSSRLVQVVASWDAVYIETRLFGVAADYRYPALTPLSYKIDTQSKINNSAQYHLRVEHRIFCNSDCSNTRDRNMKTKIHPHTVCFDIRGFGRS